MRHPFIKIAAVILALSASQARADLIADLNGSPTGGVTPVNSTWQNYNYEFVAQYSTTVLTFLIRNDPSFMGLDTISVALQGDSTNIVTNGGLDQGPDANSGLAPAGWATVGEQGLAAAGQSRSGTPGSTFGSPQAGTGWWYDGAVGGHDGIAQNIATTVGSTYDLSFWIGSNPVPNGSSVDYQVFAGSLPSNVTVTSGTITDTPEPVSAALLGAGLLGLAAARRKRA